MEDKLNIIPRFFRNILFENSQTQLKFMIIVVLIIAILALFHGSINENMLNASSIIIVIISGFFFYLFFKKQYNRKIKNLKQKIRKYSNPTVLDDLCSNVSTGHNKNVCIKYSQSKKNFNNIIQLLLDQYQYNK